jgi:fibrillarin-like pre-rRNA processing protein
MRWEGGMIWIDRVLVSPGEGGVYGERMLKGYRIWDPYRSKFAAFSMLGGKVELDDSMVVLYLGAANGTTVSHVADYAESVYAVEFAPRPMQDLLEVARRRKNIVPILGDATRPGTYAPFVEPVDLVYQDVAQPDQTGIAAKNLVFLKRGGIMLLMLKTQSVDVTRDPREVFADARVRLEGFGLEILDSRWLDPYHRDHAAIVCRKR